jgi:predicted ATPase
MIFKRISFFKQAKANRCEWTAWFVADNWDDRGFKTMFTVHLLSPTGVRHDLGSVKIGTTGFQSHQSTDQHPLPSEFTQLDDAFFSVGQDVEYYSTLRGLGDAVRSEFLTAMRDIAFTPELLDTFADEPVLDISLLRSVHANSLKTQYHRLAHGQNRLEGFCFEYERGSDAPISIQFNVAPESQPPTNVHVLIGSNGVGKTTLLKRFADIVRFPALKEEHGEKFGFVQSQDGTDAFWTLIAVAFSAFDSFGEQPKDDTHTSSADVKYCYFGLKTAALEEGKDNAREIRSGDDLWSHKSTSDLIEEFKTLLGFIVRSKKGKSERFAEAINILASDPLIKASRFCEDFNLKEFLISPQIGPLIEEFSEMSSGHKIVLLSIAGLVSRVDEKTLVLIDEPETHLHPPLLSAYIRAVSSLLIEQNGVAIVATHSPVVLQEVPKSCVWKISRQGDAFRVDRPGTETFGENVGTLTREVFNLEVTESGFFQMIKELVKKHETYEEVIDALGEQLGAEGRAMVRILFAEKQSV